MTARAPQETTVGSGAEDHSEAATVADDGEMFTVLLPVVGAAGPPATLMGGEAWRITNRSSSGCGLA
jgi:hypothetical protein